MGAGDTPREGKRGPRDPGPPYPYDGAHAPSPDELRHPLAPSVSSWLTLFIRAVKGRRLYPTDNPVLRGYVERAQAALTNLLSEIDSLRLAVREDRLVFENEVVLVDPDRVEGLPFLLFRNAIQQLELERGITADELAALAGELAKDAATPEEAGEDLVTSLWRADLPHVGYLVIDLFNMKLADQLDADASAVLIDDEMRRLRAEVAQLTATVEGQGESPRVDKATGVDALLHAASTPTPESSGLARSGFRSAVRESLSREDGSKALLLRLTRLLLESLLEEGGAVEGRASWRLLLVLVDATLRGRLEDALRITTTLTTTMAEEPRWEAREIARRLLMYLGAKRSVRVILEALDNTSDPTETRAGIALLDHLGLHAYPALLELVSSMGQPQARRHVVGVLARYTQRDDGRLLAAASGLRAEVLRDLMAFTEELPPVVLGGLVWLGVESADPALRARAVGVLRGFSGPEADMLLARALRDSDADVRMVAYRVGGHRRSQVVLDAFLEALRSKGIDALDPSEVRALVGGAVALAGDKLTPVLDGLLNGARGLGIVPRGVELRLAAAHGLGQIGSASARAALERGARSVTRRIAQACAHALEPKSSDLERIDRSTRHGPLPPRPGPTSRPRSPIDGVAASSRAPSSSRDLSPAPRSDARETPLGPRSATREPSAPGVGPGPDGPAARDPFARPTTRDIPRDELGRSDAVRRVPAVGSVAAPATPGRGFAGEVPVERHVASPAVAGLADDLDLVIEAPIDGSDLVLGPPEEEP